jgi:hypothetical protein
MNNINVYKFLLPLSILLSIVFFFFFWIGFTQLGSNLDYDLTYILMLFVLGGIFYFISLIDLHLANKRNQVSDVKQNKFVRVGAIIITINLLSLLAMALGISSAVY